MIVERALPFDHQLSRTIIDYRQLSLSLSLFKFFMLVDDSFSRLTTRMIVHDSFSVSCFGNHRSDSGRKTCCLALSSRKIHSFTSLSYETPFGIRIFTRKELGTYCSRDFAYTTTGELSSTITNFFGRLTVWTMSSGRINYHRLSRAVWPWLNNVIRQFWQLIIAISTRSFHV